MSGYWIDSPDNPFNQMSWTRGGGGYDNDQTRESNERRASAMSGAGASALPHFATGAIAQAAVPNGYAVVGDHVVQTGVRVRQQGVPGAGGGQTGGQTVITSGDGVKRSGSKLTLPEGAGPLKLSIKDKATGLLIGGHPSPVNAGWSDTEEAEARYGDSEFLSPTWFYSWAVTGADLGRGARDWLDAQLEQAGPTNSNPVYEPQPRWADGWVTYDEGQTWEFGGDGPAHYWDIAPNNPSGSPWR